MPEQQKTYKDARTAIGWIKFFSNGIFVFGSFAFLYGAFMWFGSKKDDIQQIMNACIVILSGLGTVLTGVLMGAFADVSGAVVDTAQNTAEIVTLLQKQK